MQGRDLQQRVWRRSGRESEKAILPLMPGNAGGGKGLYFWCAFEGNEKR
jgi:hypothetical protein